MLRTRTHRRVGRGGWALPMPSTRRCGTRSRPTATATRHTRSLHATILAPRPPGPGAAWSLPAAAPALGLLGLAGAWPALAGQARGWTARAALGGLGGLWLVLAEALTSDRLLFGQPRDVLAPGAWDGSVIDA